MSRSNLDAITRALFAHLRGGNPCEENELLELMHRCPRCSRSLFPLVLDVFIEEIDGKQYERIWWTCPGIGDKTCDFPLDIPKEVFWTSRTMEQRQLGIKPSPNLHLLPKQLETLYPKLFGCGVGQSRIDVERLVERSTYIPPDSITVRDTPEVAERVSQDQKLIIQTSTEPCASGSGLSLTINLPADPSVCYGSSVLILTPNPLQSNNNIVIQATSVPPPSPPTAFSFFPENTGPSVRAFLKEKMEEKSCRHGHLADREHRKAIDLCPNANAALNSHLLLNGVIGDPNKVLDTLTSADVREKTNSFGWKSLPQQQCLRLKNVIKSAQNELNKAPIENNEEAEKNRRRRQAGKARYVYTPQMAREMSKKRGRGWERRERGKVPKAAKNMEHTSGGVAKELTQVQRSRSSKEISDRLYGVSGMEHRVTEQRQSPDWPAHTSRERRVLPVRSYSRQTASSEGRSSTRSNDSDGIASASGHRIPADPCGLADRSLAEKIKRNYEGNVRRALEQQQYMGSSRCVTPSSVQSSLDICRRSDIFLSDHLSGSGGNLSGIPHDFHGSLSLHHPPMNHFPRNQLIPINYVEGEDVFAKFDAYNRDGSLVVTEVKQSTLAMDMQDELIGTHHQQQQNGGEYDFGLGLEDEFGGAGSADIGGDDDSAFLRSQMDMMH